LAAAWVLEDGAGNTAESALSEEMEMVPVLRTEASVIDPTPHSDVCFVTFKLATTAKPISKCAPCCCHLGG
jgi:hypothetical protein